MHKIIDIDQYFIEMVEEILFNNHNKIVCINNDLFYKGKMIENDKLRYNINHYINSSKKSIVHILVNKTPQITKFNFNVLYDYKKLYNKVNNIFLDIAKSNFNSVSVMVHEYYSLNQKNKIIDSIIYDI